MPVYPTNQSKWILWRKKNWSHGTVCSRPFFCLTVFVLFSSSYRWNPTYKFLIRPGSYRKVPIAVIDGQQINGSDEIVSTLLNKDFVKDALEKKWNQTPDMTLSIFINGTSSTSVSSLSSDKPTTVQYWTTEFANDLAAILYPNIAATWSDSYQMFRYVDEKPNSFSYLDKFLIRNVGSLAMTMAASKIKSRSFSFSSWFNLQPFYFSYPFLYTFIQTQYTEKRGIQNERLALQEALLKWEREGIHNGQVPFSSGIDQPNLADLAIFGVLNSCSGLAVHNELIVGNQQPLGKWYKRMHQLTFFSWDRYHKLQ